MARKQRAGLDELMIVNPGTPGAVRTVVVKRRRRRLASGVGAVEQEEGRRRNATATPTRRVRARFFLGDDGALYEVIE